VAVLRSANGDAQSRRVHEHGALRLIEWSDGEHRFAVSGAHSEASLRRLADAVQDFAASTPTHEI
jgi:anti-sigma factor RsiW